MGPRLTAPAAKMVRAISTASQAARQSWSMNPSVSALLPRVPASERNSKQSRPFHPTAAGSARMDASTMDFCVLPAASAPTTTSPSLRVPLLPDNFVTQHAPEEDITPLPKPQIHVMAPDPDLVMPAALTDVDNFEYEGITFGFMRDSKKGDANRDRESSRMLKDIWAGLQDVVGDKSVAL